MGTHTLCPPYLTMSLTLSDGYDFEPMNDSNTKGFVNQRLKNANNRAYMQQEMNRIENYFLTTSIFLSKEELERILKMYWKLKY